MTFNNADGDLIQGHSYTVKIIIWDHTVLAVADRWLLNRDVIGFTGAWYKVYGHHIEMGYRRHDLVRSTQGQGHTISSKAFWHQKQLSDVFQRVVC